MDSCKICESKETIETTFCNMLFSLRIDEEHDDILLLRLETGYGGLTKPIGINYCMACGRKLNNS